MTGRPVRINRSNISNFAWVLPAVVVTCVASGVPIAWVLWVTIAHASDLLPGRLDLDLLGWTMAYNTLASVLAVALALPVGWVLGRGRGWVNGLLWVVVPLVLFMPTIALTYGWNQLLGLAGIRLMPAGGWDVIRCVGILAMWLWPIPACAVGLALRRADPSVAEQALLDGVLFRQTLRQLRGTLLLGGAVVLLIASQEFAVFEPTGIRVVATEVRVVFESIAASRLLEGVTADQRARAAAAVTTAIPLLAITMTVALAATLLAMRDTDDRETPPDRTPQHARLAPKFVTSSLAWLIAILSLAGPMTGLIASSRQTLNPLHLWQGFAPEVVGSLTVASVTGAIAIVVAISVTAAVSGPMLRRVLMAVAVASFLLGGQMIAIALIRTFNRPQTFGVYDSMAMPVLAYLARFGWIAILAGAVTWTRPWRQLREQAQVDGASTSQTIRLVLARLAWPVWLAGGLLVMAQSVTEVPATVLIAPQSPPMLVPMLIAWVHIARYEPMIQASVLMMLLVGLLTSCGAVLWAAGRRR